jgi:hypothetical protein
MHGDTSTYDCFLSEGFSLDRRYVVVTRTGTDDRRFYYQPLARLTMRSYAVFGFILWLCLAGGPRISPAIRALAVVAGFAYLVACWYVGGRGLEARPDGIRFRRWFQWRSIRWGDIKTFTVINPHALSPTVFVELVSGDRKTMPFTQKRLTRWNGGKSRDTVAVLNLELDQARTRSAGPRAQPLTAG